MTTRPPRGGAAAVGGRRRSARHRSRHVVLLAARRRRADRCARAGATPTARSAATCRAATCRAACWSSPPATTGRPSGSTGRIAAGVVALANVAVEWGPPPALQVERVLAQRMIVIDSTLGVGRTRSGARATLVHEMTHTATGHGAARALAAWLAASSAPPRRSSRLRPAAAVAGCGAAGGGRRGPRGRPARTSCRSSTSPPPPGRRTSPATTRASSPSCCASAPSCSARGDGRGARRRRPRARSGRATAGRARRARRSSRSRASAFKAEDLDSPGQARHGARAGCPTASRAWSGRSAPPRRITARKTAGRLAGHRRRAAPRALPWEVARVPRRAHPRTSCCSTPPGLDAGELRGGLERAYRQIRRDLPRRDLPRSVLVIAAREPAPGGAAQRPDRQRRRRARERQRRLGPGARAARSSACSSQRMIVIDEAVARRCPGRSARGRSCTR